jgi:formylglycine-generating enzyme required for sulfatase activity
MGKRYFTICALVTLSAFVLPASADVFGTGANQFTIDFVNISSATNPTSGYGVVNNDYRMGSFEITNDQWNKFKAELGVPVTGDPSNAYNENPYWTGTNVPTNYVSWYEAAQFVNWLNTSKGYHAAYKFTGTQGQGDYSLDTWLPSEADNGTNLYRHKDAMYYMPTEDEWVKAAYWNGTNLQTWATPDDSQPVTGDDSNYAAAVGKPWNVGSGSQEINGTYDMMGNVWEWTEDSSGVIRGGAYGNDGEYLRSSVRISSFDPTTENGLLGFRVAAIPEPATMGLLAIFGLVTVGYRRLLRAIGD